MAAHESLSIDLLITNIKGLVQVREDLKGPVAGRAMAELPVLGHSFVAIKGEIIFDYGPMHQMPAYTAAEIIDAEGKFVLPGFVDSHTHLVFAASREEEFVMKINGASYQEIAAKGGGILNSATRLQHTSEGELLERTLLRAREIISTGTAAVEIKSGYGLTVKDELKMLRVARQVARHTPLTVKTTLLGAHAVPKDISKPDYIKLVMHEMIPAVAEEKLADYIDVFCEEGFFTVDETERIVEEGKKFGLKPRIHANQLARSGGVQVGVKTGALSVDHLEHIDNEEIDALLHSNTMPTVLPCAAFFLGLPFPPARRMIEAGLPVAIASDFNPGSSPSGNMPFMISLACIKMKMTPEEAINASTINTAHAIEVLGGHGSITRGKTASLFVTKKIPSLAYLPYAVSSPLVDVVILKGRIQTPGDGR
jgi:imidazolonepropionase